MNLREPGAEYEHALRATRRHHARHKTFSGRFLVRYIDDVKAIVETHGCKTMLDYGCGKGVQYEQPLANGQFILEFLGVEVTKYDPGVPQFAVEPVGKFDIVICTQVIGSIPLSAQEWFVDRLYGFASKAVYVGERCGRKVKKQIHTHMASAMPQMWTHEQWAAILRRPGSPIACYLGTMGGPRRLESLNG